MSGKKRITVAYGDGIGPEIMKATLNILEAAGAPLEYDVITIGEQVYLNGGSTGIEDSSWDTIRKNKVFLKSPITTPQGGGFKSMNVTVRKSLGLYANVRPVKAYHPYVRSHFPDLNLTIIRENEEDLYAGIEHQQTIEVVQTLKLVSRPGIESIVRYAFEYAKANNRKKVTCMTKDNIMKQADGLFSKIFREIAVEYPDIEANHMIIDIGSAKLANNPEMFDVVVTLNLYGDIISDIVAEVAGSVGMGGSSNVGDKVSMFEAIHGSAPDIAGKNIANPSGLINGAIMMLVHMGMADIAETIENAWLRTLEDGIHTGDIYKQGMSTQRAGTQEFAEAVIARLGQKPEQFDIVTYNKEAKPINVSRRYAPRNIEKELVGIDVFLDWIGEDRDPQVLGDILKACECDFFELKIITNRGVKVYPECLPETFRSDHWRCRYLRKDESKPATLDEILKLMANINKAGLEFIKTEQLYTFDGVRGYSLGQGE